MQNYIWLVVWNMELIFDFPQELGWWSNLTKSIIFQGGGEKPPIRQTVDLEIWIYAGKVS